MYRKTHSELSRFLEKINKSPTGCWIWNSTKISTGYGHFHRKGEKNFKTAHRVSWELFRSPIPDGMCVLHKCDVKLCVNPYHLFLGTRHDNMRDCSRKNRIAFGTKNGFCKFSDDTITDIRIGHDSGQSTSSLSREYGVSWSHIKRIVTKQARTKRQAV